MKFFAPFLALIAYAALCASPNPAAAQGCGAGNPNCVAPTPPVSPCDSSNRIATTAFVATCGTGGGGGLPSLANGDIWIGNASNVAIAQALSGDATVSNTGVITVAKVNGATLAAIASSGSAADLIAGTVALNRGGTNASLSASAGGLVYSTASGFAILPGTVTAGLCALSGSNAPPTWGSCTGTAAVASVTAADGTVTISPTTGAVVAGLNLGNANTWTAVQTFTNSDFKLLGSSTGGTVLTSDNAGASNFTMHLPAANDTLATIASAQTFTNKTWNGVPITGSFIGTNTVANSNLAQALARTVKCNSTASTANDADCTSIDLRPASAGLNTVYAGTAQGSGSTGGVQQYFNYDNIASDVTNTGSDPAVSYSIGRLVNYAFGGAAKNGGVEGLFVALTQIAPTNSSTVLGAAVNAGGSGYGSSATGTVTWSGAGCSVNPVLNVTANGSGVITAVNSITVAGTCTTFPSNNAATWTPGGGLSAGTGAKFYVQNRFYVAVSGQAQANSSDGGVLPASPQGLMYGSSFLGVLTSGATGFEEVAAGFDQVVVTTGASTKLKAIHQLVYGSLDAVQGTTDATILISADPGASAGGKNGILFTDVHGVNPMASNAYLIKTETTTSATIAGLADVSAYTVSTCLIKLAFGCVIDGSGNGNFANQVSGAWTPQIAGSTAAGTPTYNAQVGHYSHNGKDVIATFVISATALTGMTGIMQIANLPFTSNTITNDQGSCTFNTVSGMAFDAGYTWLAANISNGSVKAALVENGGGVAGQGINVSKFTAPTVVLAGSCIYHTD